MTDRRLPLSVIGGYLGAGKTTLVNGLLADPRGERIAVLVNDFGEIDIDTSLIADHDGDTLSLANGCICCSLVDGVAQTQGRIREMADRLDRVVVEVSGVGQPHKVAQWARTPGFLPDGVVVLVDAETVEARAVDRYVGDTVRSQIAAADLLVATRADVIDADRMAAVTTWLGELSSAPALSAPVDRAILFGLEPHGIDDGATPADHVTASVNLNGPVDRSTLDTWFAVRPRGVIRAKGLIELADRPGMRTVVHVAGASHAATPDGPLGDTGAAVVAIALPGTPRAGLVKWLKMLED